MSLAQPHGPELAEKTKQVRLSSPCVLVEEADLEPCADRVHVVGAVVVEVDGDAAGVGGRVAVGVVPEEPALASDGEGLGLDGLAVAEALGAGVAVDLEHVRPGDGQWPGHDGGRGLPRGFVAAADDLGRGRA